MKFSSRGFTLLEVMVALAILALVMVAVFTSLTNQIKTTVMLRDKSIGLWIAHNVLTTYQMRGLGSISNNDLKSGTESQLNQKWSWRLTTSETALPGIIQVKVQVALAPNSHEIASLTGYANLENNT
jgi:general secretion pathway protein I